MLQLAFTSSCPSLAALADTDAAAGVSGILFPDSVTASSHCQRRMWILCPSHALLRNKLPPATSPKFPSLKLGETEWIYSILQLDRLEPNGTHPAGVSFASPSKVSQDVTQLRNPQSKVFVLGKCIQYSKKHSCFPESSFYSEFELYSLYSEYSVYSFCSEYVFFSFSSDYSFFLFS